MFSQHILRQYKNFTIFVRSAAVIFPSKIQFSKNCLKVCRNTSFDEWNKEFCQKIFSYHILRQYKIFTIFVRVAAVDFPSKIQISKNCLKVCRITSFDEWNKEFCPKKNFFAHFEIVQNFHHFCKVRGCRFSVKNSIFQKLPKSLQKHFF